MRTYHVLTRTILRICLALAVMTPLPKASQARGDAYVQALAPARFDGDASKSAVLRSGLDDEHWDNQFGQPGMNGGVNVMLIGPDGDLYAGGGFQQAGGVTVNHIARWDGTAWHPLGSGMDSTVHTMAFGSNGDLYAGGDFFMAGGVTVNHIARWDGVAWHSLGSGMSGRVNALAVGIDGSVYAGGLFTVASGVTVNRIARWNGATWYPLGSGMNSWVDALVMGQDGILYASGNFTHAGGATVNHIARWNGVEWSPLGPGFSGDRSARTLVFGGDGYLYAGGTFTVAGGLSAHYIARWDGDSWEALSSEVNSFVFALAVGLDGSLYAGGAFPEAGGETTNFIARWDGTVWHPLGSGMDNWVHTLVFGPDGSLFVGGEFTSAGGTPSSYVARWTGMAAPPGDPVVLVHGYKGLNLSLFGDNRDQRRSCSAGIELYSSTNPRHAEWNEIKRNLSGYSVYVANLNTSEDFTPRIEENARCLRDQINRVAQLTGRPVIVIAHSMGGLVSRAYMENEELYQDTVAHLITLGTPHGGINLAKEWFLQPTIFGIEPSICGTQPFLCQLMRSSMEQENRRYRQRADNVGYTLIGGIWNDAQARVFERAEGPNDTWVGVASANGKYWDRGNITTIAVHDNHKPVDRYQTAIDHSGYFSDTVTIDCIKFSLDLGGGCPPPAEMVEGDTSSAPSLSGQTIDLAGTLNAGQMVGRTLAVDTTGASVFMLIWTHGQLSLTLTDPAGLAITPSYAAANPAVVSYGSESGTPETLPWASYSFTNTVPGLWTVSMEATSAPSDGTSYLATVYVETDLQFAAVTDQALYQIGDTATISAALDSAAGGFAGAEVEAIIARSDGITETVPLVDQGNGDYQATYNVSDPPGLMLMSVMATGENAGLSFSRQADLVVRVASPNVMLDGQYSARTPDDNGDGNFDALLIDVSVSATAPSVVLLSGTMVSAEVTRTVTAVATAEIDAGTHVVTLDFPGRSIHRLRGDGPYTLTTVLLEDITLGGVPADTANDAFVTAAYDHRQFGLRGDVDDSCAVDIEDVISIASTWNMSDFDPVLDINRDGVIAIADIMLAAGNWGSSCWE